MPTSNRLSSRSNAFLIRRLAGSPSAFPWGSPWLHRGTGRPGSTGPPFVPTRPLVFRISGSCRCRKTHAQHSLNAPCATDETVHRFPVYRQGWPRQSAWNVTLYWIGLVVATFVPNSRHFFLEWLLRISVDSLCVCQEFKDWLSSTSTKSSAAC